MKELGVTESYKLKRQVARQVVLSPAALAFASRS